MTSMVVAHPIAGFTGRVAVEEFGLAFVGGFTGPLDVPANIQTQLTAAGFTLNATLRSAAPHHHEAPPPSRAVGRFRAFGG